MPKLRKADVDDIDADALDEATYSTEEYDSYDGETPPVGILLRAYVKRMWWTRTQEKPGGGGDDPMLKVLVVAGDNDGDRAKYNGCPFWLNLALIKSVKFRWGPMFEHFGLTMREVTTKTYVESLTDTSDPNGAKVQRIGTFKPGEDQDGAWCTILTGQEAYNGSMQPRVKAWLDYEAYEEGAEDGDGDEPEEPEDEYYDEDSDEADEYDEADEDYDEDEEGDEDEDEDEDEEPEEPEETPRRGRAAPARSARGARTASKAAPARTGSRARPAAAKAPASARTGSRARPAAAATSTRGRGRGAAAKSDEPPF